MAPAHSTLIAVPSTDVVAMDGALNSTVSGSSLLDSACVGEGPVPVRRFITEY
jgi:hypothetical protein